MPGSMESRADRPDRTPQNNGGVAVTHILEITEDDHFAVPAGERQNRAAQPLQFFASLQRSGHIAAVHGLSRIDDVFVERDELAIARKAPSCLVPSHSVQ